MSCQLYAVSLTPITAGVGKSLGKSFGNVIVVSVTCERHLAVGQIPKQLGQRIYKRFSVGSLERILKIVCPGQSYVLSTLGKGERALARKLRLVGENCGDGVSKIISDGVIVSFVSDLNKFFNSLFIQRINVRSVAVSRRVGCYLTVYRPYGALCLVSVVYECDLRRRRWNE